MPWVTAVVMAAMLPMLFARVNNQDDEPQQASIWQMFKRRDARLGINGCIISGIVLGSLYGLMPLYLNHQGMSDANVGYWMALLVSSGIVGQWPIGRLADRYGRLLVLRIQVFVVILASIAMLGNYAMAPALFILGCAGFTLYPVAMSWACEKVQPHQLVAMNQTLLMSYTVGSLLGPIDDVDADAELLRSAAVCDDCGSGAGLSGDAAEETGPSPHPVSCGLNMKNRSFDWQAD
ncbi:Uncharacterized MFS-type transporter ycaD [Serratia fonticola]|uniref:Uncharacterized MFS-type transporter ycaD n=1 Tax=Serratia fonticola TaxID=47917 RepID=A0A4U9UWP4_SERFO|nr:Uncharacterized MFS-type transporter ycaD [Serratia fonticola]